MSDPFYRAENAAPPPRSGAPDLGHRGGPIRTEDVYRVAIRLFLERGYDATPLSLIASELGITKAGVYYHFRSKEQLLFEIHRQTLEQQLLPILERAEREADPARRLERYLREYVELMGSDPSIRLMIDETKRLDPEHVEEIRAVWRRGYQLMRRSIEELQAAGRCNPSLHPSYAAFAAIGMCTWTLYWFDHDRPETLGEIAGELAHILLRGLGAEPGSDPADPAAGRAAGITSSGDS